MILKIYVCRIKNLPGTKCSPTQPKRRDEAIKAVTARTPRPATKTYPLQTKSLRWCYAKEKFVRKAKFNTSVIGQRNVVKVKTMKEAKVSIATFPGLRMTVSWLLYDMVESDGDNDVEAILECEFLMRSKVDNRSEDTDESIRIRHKY